VKGARPPRNWAPGGGPVTEALASYEARVEEGTILRKVGP
jgi:hypothetical protein